jgi:hypothetical protein
MPAGDGISVKKEKTRGTVLMDDYASGARKYMKKYGLTQMNMRYLMDGPTLVIQTINLVNK